MQAAHLRHSGTPTVGELVAEIKSVVNEQWYRRYTDLQAKAERLNAWRFWLGIALALAVTAAVVGWLAFLQAIKY